MSTVIVETLIENLSEGVVSFKYRKSDGSLREAKGTTNLNLIPEANRPATTVVTDGPAISYFDVDANGWRSFRRDSVVA